MTLQKEWCEDIVDLDFCDTKLMASSHWDEVLTWIYGDYETSAGGQADSSHSTIEIQVFDEEV